MSNCNIYEEMVSAYADGQLTDSDRWRVEEHLSECGSCSALLEMFREISAAAKESLVEPPPALRENVMEAISSGKADIAADKMRKLRIAGLITTRLIPIAACFALLLIALPNITNMLRTPSDTGAAPRGETNGIQAAGGTGMDAGEVAGGEPAPAAPAPAPAPASAPEYAFDELDVYAEEGGIHDVLSGSAESEPDTVPAPDAPDMAFVPDTNEDDGILAESAMPADAMDEAYNIQSAEHESESGIPDSPDYAIVMITGNLPDVFADAADRAPEPALGQSGGGTALPGSPDDAPPASEPERASAPEEAAAQRWYVIMPRDKAEEYAAANPESVIVEIGDIAADGANFIYWNP